jgi:LDH2 family malate/lactate/ureidoglycolate dehydrogenase
MDAMADEIRVQHERLKEIIRTAVSGLGVSDSVGQVEAEVMAEADLQGVPSHGVRMLPELLRGIRDGRVNPRPEPRLVRERKAISLLDGDNGPGRFVSVEAMKNAIDSAKQFGVGACLANRLCHWGRAHAYASRAAAEGLIGICTTNAISNMLAWGSSRPLLGNNPLAIGVPRGQGQEPLVLDMAMSQAAIGKIGTFLREGKKVPTNWGLDATGKSSEDPAAILASGRVLPFGEHKGAGLAFMIELLTGGLSGGPFSFEIGKADTSGLDPGSSKLFLAIDVEAFIEVAQFHWRVEEFVSYLRSAEPGLEITLPGERGWKTRERNLSEGIPIHREIVEQLRAAEVRLE